MSRARNIKPSFFMNEALGEVPYEARLFFIGLWCLCDPEGKMEFRPKRVKAELFPYDDVDCTVLARCLHDAGLIKVYEVGGEAYLWVPNFIKHQTPHMKEKPRGYPDYSASYEEAPDKPGAEPVQAHLNPESVTLNPDALKEDVAPVVASIDKPKKKASIRANPRTSLVQFLENSGGFPPAEWGAWAHEQFGWDGKRISFEWDDFQDYWTSGNAVGGGLKSDWPATWRGHCRRNSQNSRRGGGTGGTPNGGLAAALHGFVARGEGNRSADRNGSVPAGGGAGADAGDDERRFDGTDIPY